VAVDLPLPHLDRPFDYLVPAGWTDAVQPGSRVRVRFSGQLVDGVVLDRVASSGHDGRLAYLERAVSAEPVLSAEVARLARAVADRWAGSLSDVLRLALPPRHARVEAEPAAAEPGSAGAAARPGSAGAAAARSGSAGPGSAGAGPAGPGSAARGEADPPAGWLRYPAGPAWLRAVAAARPARAVWSALPGEDWPARVAEAVGAARSAGRGALVVVPDHRDLSRVDSALAAELGAGRHVALAAELGPAQRYRRWLAVRRGAVGVAAGTRAAAFAPVADLGLVVLWDDGDDLHAEPRAPYPHARELLVLRAHLAGAAMLLGGYARSVESQLLVESGWAHEVVADRATVRAAAPRLVAAGDESELARDPAARTARLPSVAWRAAREALADGAPVLVQVPRRGYRPVLACARCRAGARCRHCHGPLAASSGHAVPACRWCGRPTGRWACAVCGNTTLRAVVTGSDRTAEELGRAFPGVPVRVSGAPARPPARPAASPAGRPPGGQPASPPAGQPASPAAGPAAGPADRPPAPAPDGAARRRSADRAAVLPAVPAEPALIVATPGAEPVADGGYGAALLLDGWALLTRPDLRTAEETLRRWLNAAALVRPAAAGGRVVIGADGGLAVVQALVRWDPGWFAARELAERAELGFPPAVRFASLTGAPAAVAELVEAAALPPGAQLLGPVPAAGRAGAETERLLVRTPRSDAAALARALHDAAAVRSARKAADPVRIQLDPLELF
jgi:primosomal protein N' (replication factor Y)